MYKSSRLGSLAICRRLALMLFIWPALLLGIYEIHQASENHGSSNNDESRRLAIYSILLKLKGH